MPVRLPDGKKREREREEREMPAPRNRAMHRDMVHRRRVVNRDLRRLVNQPSFSE